MPSKLQPLNTFPISTRWYFWASRLIPLAIILSYVATFGALAYYQTENPGFLIQDISVSYWIALAVILILGWYFFRRYIAITDQYIQIFSRKKDALSGDIISKESIQGFEIGRYKSTDKYSGAFQIMFRIADGRKYVFEMREDALRNFYQKWLEYGYTPISEGVDYKQFQQFLSEKKKKAQKHAFIAVLCVLIAIFFIFKYLDFFVYGIF